MRNLLVVGYLVVELSHHECKFYLDHFPDIVNDIDGKAILVGEFKHVVHCVLEGRVHILDKVTHIVILDQHLVVYFGAQEDQINLAFSFLLRGAGVTVALLGVED